MELVRWQYRNPYHDRSTAPTRQFIFGPHVLTITQQPSQSITLSQNTGFLVWDGAYLLSQHVFNHLTLRGKKCVELGAGSALVSMVAWLKQADAVATDLAQYQDFARQNIRANGAQVDVQEVVWGEALPQALAGSADVVFGSEILYLEEQHKALIHTLRGLMRENARAYLVYKDRGLGEHRFHERARIAGDTDANSPHHAHPAGDAELATLAGQQLHLDAPSYDPLEWLDIGALMTQATGELAVGELLRPPSLTYYDALISVEVMKPQLDMGMLSPADLCEIAKWDPNRRLSLRQVLWVVEELVRCELTWHSSASLLQTMYMCNYFTVDEAPREALSGEGREPRDRVLFPLVVALAHCCRLVWMEYLRENLFSEEDVHFGSQPVEFFGHIAREDVVGMLRSATAYLQDALGTEEDEGEREAAQVLLAHVGLRTRWLRVLADLSLEYLAEDPAALDRGMAELSGLQEAHAAFTKLAFDPELPVTVPGCFDPKCMRKYPSMAPIKPRPLLSRAETHEAFAGMLRDLSLLRQLLHAESVEALVNFLGGFSRRQPTPLPFVRSLVASVLSSNDTVLLRESLVGFVQRAIRETSGGYVWDVLDGLEGRAEVVLALRRGVVGSSALLDDPLAARTRVDGFCREAARHLVDWFRTMCQNAPRQRRVYVKYLASWDALQGDAEELDTWLYAALAADSIAEAEAEAEANDPRCNPFWFSSWVYHVKLLLIENALLGGVRLGVYLGYELAQVYGYAAQVFQVHRDHLDRMAKMTMGRTGQNPGLCRAAGVRRQEEDACVAGLGRWLDVVEAQNYLATALWLVSHACDRLGLVRAPWWPRRGKALSAEALSVWRAQEADEAQATRYALRFRAFSRLNSPTPLTYAGWTDTVAQLDDSPAADLVAHAERLLAKARDVLDRMGRRGSMRGWDEVHRGIRYAVVVNAVALAKLQAAGVARCPAALVPGSQAAAYQRLLVEADGRTAAAEEEEGPGREAEMLKKPVSKARAKRDRKRRKQETGLARDAAEWHKSADALPLAASSKCCETGGHVVLWSQFSFDAK
ncbi:N-alpha-acetyltransferase, non-catalitic subunit [Coemansia interrupta]|uniref:N-alpha-acetyltransferase, non-catalitic subunit n=1 Tax=Coemansia interrupta TaxID=1126814 RepID=A0A9W8HJK9_9FUNG|nr:N-alpha-acetyltransferase, non-catalitic subunit [Coemansia interrupta]